MHAYPFITLIRFVFDGKAPTLKSEELAKRSSKKAGAATDLEEAKEARNRNGLGVVTINIQPVHFLLHS